MQMDDATLLKLEEIARKAPAGPYQDDVDGNTGDLTVSIPGTAPLYIANLEGSDSSDHALARYIATFSPETVIMLITLLRNTRALYTNAQVETMKRVVALARVVAREIRDENSWRIDPTDVPFEVLNSFASHLQYHYLPKKITLRDIYGSETRLQALAELTQLSEELGLYSDGV